MSAVSLPTTVLVPCSAVIGRSVFSRKVMQGTPRAVVSSCTPPESVITNLADFINPTGLQPIGENLYMESAASGAPQVGNPDSNGLGSVVQGSLEGSNVNVVEELVNMIQTQRAYELNSKAVSTSDQMLQKLSQL